MSPHRPVAIKSNGKCISEASSGDTLATDAEVDAIVRDASFEQNQKWKSLVQVSMTSILTPSRLIAVISVISIDLYRFPTLDDEEFCRKLNIVLSSGKLSYGSLSGHLSTWRRLRILATLAGSQWREW